MCKFLELHIIFDINYLQKLKNFPHVPEQDRVDIIYKLEESNPPTKRALARVYNVTEKTIREVWKNRVHILEQVSQIPEAKRAKTFRHSSGYYQEIETRLVSWIKIMRDANLVVPPSLALLKAKKLRRLCRLQNFKGRVSGLLVCMIVTG